MSRTVENDRPGEPFDGTFGGTRRRQILAGLELEPIQRLRWLERTVAELRKLQGRAASRRD